MKILQIDKFYFVKGGVERYMFELTDILQSYEHEVIPFSMKHEQNLKTEYDDYFVENINFNIPALTQKIVNIPKITSRLFYSFEAKRKLERLIEDTKPDIAHIHMIDHQISPSILHTLKKCKIPILQTVHHYKLVCPNYRLYIDQKGCICEKCLTGNYYHAVLEKCHKNSYSASLLVCLETYFHKMLKIYENNIDLFHVPSKFIGRKIAQAGISEKKIEHLFLTIKMEDFPFSPDFDNYFVSYGRLSNEKGFPVLLDAMKKIKNAQLIVIGDGPQRPELEKIKAENDLANVEFVGSKDRDELISIIAKSKFVVLPSQWYENSPLVIYESFALGKPVIGADIGGIPEFINPGEDGLLFEAGNAEELSEKIHILLEDSAKIKSFGARAREKAEREFAPEKHYKKIMKIYQGLVN